MKSRLKVFLLWLVLSVAIGYATGPLIPADVRDSEKELNMGSLGKGLGQGITLAVVGGYRNIAANLVWISMYGDWQYRRSKEVADKMNLAVSLSPESLYFWIDGSRIVANDMPVWVVGDDYMESLFEEESGIGVRKQYGQIALDFLNRAPSALQDRPAILVEKGMIAWRRLGNLDQAIEFFRRAALSDGAPYYISRVYAELLARAGRIEEALSYLEKHYAALPDGDPAAMKGFVANRIAELRRMRDGD